MYRKRVRSRPVSEKMDVPGSEADRDPTFRTLVHAEPGTLKTP
jgi:hypothetical protein